MERNFDYSHNYDQFPHNPNLFFELHSNLGFENVSKSTLTTKLRSIKPCGSVAMRDAIFIASKTIIDLGNILYSQDSEIQWNFIHVVMIAGDDNCSINSLDDTCAVLYGMNLTLKVSTLKTYFIGIDLKQNSKASIEIGSLVLAGCDKSEYFNIKEDQIGDMFNQIILNIMTIKQNNMLLYENDNAPLAASQQKIDINYLLERQRFALLLTLDSSAAMSGNRWKLINESVNSVINILGGDNLVGSIVFNNTVRNVLFQDSEIHTINRQQSGVRFNNSQHNVNILSNPLIPNSGFNKENTNNQPLLVLSSSTANRRVSIMQRLFGFVIAIIFIFITSLVFFFIW